MSSHCHTALNNGSCNSKGFYEIHSNEWGPPRGERGGEGREAGSVRPHFSSQKISMKFGIGGITEKLLREVLQCVCMLLCKARETETEREKTFYKTNT